MSERNPGVLHDMIKEDTCEFHHARVTYTFKAAYYKKIYTFH